MNLVYQAVIQEKLQELELLISQNKVQQERLLWEIAGKRTELKSGKPYPANLAIGHFLKPYFKDKTSGLGPPANPEMMERSSYILKSFPELIIKKWRTTDNDDLTKAVLSDSLQRILQPKLLKLEYLQQKRDLAKSDLEKTILTKQIQDLEQEIDNINCLPEEKLLGQRTDDHDWEKISNVNLEGVHSAARLSKVWRNSLHPHVNKEPWGEEEIKKLQEIAEEHNFVNWEMIAEELGTNRTAFQCLQQFQTNNKDFKRKEFTKEEDEMLAHFVQRMRVGMHIPYRKISYFMEGREPMQLLHRWSKSLDPSLKKGHWSKEEDELLLKAVEKHGEKDWYKIRFEVPGRSDIQCRERYYKGLHKDIKKGKWSPEEEQKLILLTRKYGLGHWTKVGKEIKHRTGSQCLSKWKNMTGYFKGKKKPQRVNKAPNSASNPAPRKRPRKSTPHKRPLIKEEELSEEEDVSDISYESSSSTSESSGSDYSMRMSSCSSISSGSEDEEEEHASYMADDCNLEERRAATKFLDFMPALDSWVPRKQNLDLLCTKEQKINPTSLKVPRTNQRGRQGTYQLNTIMKGIAYPPSTDTVTENPQDFLLEAKSSGHQIVEISEDEARRILKWNTVFCEEKPVPKRALKKPTGDHVSYRRRKTPVDRQLLLAVTPWVGNIFLPIFTRYRSPWDKPLNADVMKKKLSSVTISSTPMFALLIRFFQINAGGCLQMIQLRKAQESQFMKNFKQGSHRRSTPVTMSPRSILASHTINASDVQTSPQPGSSRRRERSYALAPKPKTVYELLKEKRRQQDIAHRTPQNTAATSTSVIVSPQTVVNRPSIPAGQQPSPVPSTTLHNSVPFVTLPAHQALPTNNIISNQISTASSDPNKRQQNDAGKAVTSTQNATRNPCHRLPFVGSPGTVQVMPGSQVVASPQVVVSPRVVAAPQVFVSPQVVASQQLPVQLLQNVMNPASTTWILTPQGLVQIPVQALFPNLCQPVATRMPTVSRLSNVKAVDPSKIAESSNKVPETPTSRIVNHLPVGSSVATQLQSVQAANHPIPRPCPTLPPPSKAAQLALTPKKYPVVKIAKVLSTNKPNTGTGNVANSATPAPSQPTGVRSPPSCNDNKIDLSLVSLEDETSIKDWMRGNGNGETQKSSLAYLPPSSCTLKTFSRILLQKTTLEEKALKLVPRSDSRGEAELNRRKAVLDNMVEEKLKDNPAYNLLKQRFLSGFTFPGLLAAFPPPKSKPPMPVTRVEIKDEERELHMGDHGRQAEDNADGTAPGPNAPTQLNEAEVSNPEAQVTPMDVECEVAGNNRRQLRRRIVYHRSET
ncbi:hypothetical protein GDO81_003904 [Engystomops pustulosus]|nr:hypothetical protein GDO81_003904 [Engystomops pustulosus]KAG8554812.1 hypothetical protein GDO81_003904 [Engystomops pustulosus]